MVYQILIPALFISLYFIFKIFKEPKPFVASLKSMLFSTGALITLHALSPTLGISIPINIASLVTSAALGIPGICLMTILNVVF